MLFIVLNKISEKCYNILVITEKKMASFTLLVDFLLLFKRCYIELVLEEVFSNLSLKRMKNEAEDKKRHGSKLHSFYIIYSFNNIFHAGNDGFNLV
jgi:hypothetical protein